jgi:hypothetical protein
LRHSAFLFCRILERRSSAEYAQLRATSFDYGDFSFAQTMLLRVDDTAIVVVLNDSGAALTIVRERLAPIEGPLSPLQIREIAADLASVNIQLAERPTFSSEFSYLTEEYRMLAHRPNEWSLGNWQDEIRGGIMHHVCGPFLAGAPRSRANPAASQDGPLYFSGGRSR